LSSHILELRTLIPMLAEIPEASTIRRQHLAHLALSVLKNAGQLRAGLEVVLLVL
jgi:hypothetical protein